MKFLAMHSIVSIKNPLPYLNKKIGASATQFGAQFNAFSIFGLINYPIFYIIWISLSGVENSHENIVLRLIATLLCLGLFLRKKWPQKIKNWLPLYWYATLTYCLPFFFTLMLLHNPQSNVWNMAFISIIFWLVLLVDLVSAFLLWFIGLSAAILIFSIHNSISFLRAYAFDVAPEYIGCLVTAAIFANNKKFFEVMSKLKTAEAIGATVAHELRTPLSTIQASAKTIKNLNGTGNAQITDKVAIIDDAVTDILDEAKFSNTIINMILVNVKRNKTTGDFAQIAISSCVEKALKRYPLQKNEENLINFDNNNDFSFYGDEVAVIHVLFNLLKNSLYFIQAEKKGVIDIWFSSEKGYNVLNFRDTAKGIAKSELSKIFDKFYTTTRHGTGLGLPYCSMVMEEMGGKMQCESILNEFILFKVKFPK
jgi:signal transduction histidine kinase